MSGVIQQSWDRAPGELWIYIVALGIVYILYIFKDYIRNVKFVLSLKGPKIVPILGNANSIIEDNLLYRLAYETHNYGPVFRIWLTIMPYVFLLEPEDIRIVLSSMKHTRKIFVYKLLDNFLGKGLITRNVETWKVFRKLLQPAFHLHILERFTKTFTECADNLVNEFLRKKEQNINIAPLINDAVYNILSETVLGVKCHRCDEQNDEMPFRKGQVMVPYRLTRPWLLLDWIYRFTKAGRKEKKQRKDLLEACWKMVQEKREYIRKNGSTISENEINAARKMSLLEYMVAINEKDSYFTEEDIIEECCTFMLAGQDSVGTATAMTLFLLANHPSWQDKCVEELNVIFKHNPTRQPTMKDLKEMKCLEMCIKESLRLYPSVPLFARTLGEDVHLGKYVIPAGCGVVIAPYSTHRLSHHFSDPHSFKPERFTPENSEKRHPYAYLPFSAGPRNCIGNKFAMLEIKSMVSAILRKCRLESVTGKEQVQPKYRMTVRARGGLWVKVMTRNKIKDTS